MRTQLNSLQQNMQNTKPVEMDYRAAVLTAARPTLLYYYLTVIRSIIEYASPVWQSSLTEEQIYRLENIQRRALRIMYKSNDYELNCALYSVEPIPVRLKYLARRFFLVKYVILMTVYTVYCLKNETFN